VYTPGVPDVMKAFHVSREAALLPLTLYTLGLALGPVLAAPMSETYGRRIVYLTTIPISLLFTVGAGASQGFASLLVCRFLAGAFGGPCLAVGAGTNVELFRPINRAAATSLFLLAPFAGPTLGPTVGGYASENKGWRWTQWPILFIGALAWFYSFFQHETYKKIILQKRAKRLGIPPPKQMGPTGMAKIKFLLTVTLVRPVYMLFAEPIVGFYSLYTGFNFAVLFCFFAAFPYVFEGVYKFDRGMTGLTFLGIGLGCALAVVVFVYVDRLTYRKRLLQSRMDGKGDIIAPEYRLYPAMIGSIILPIGLFWFGWTARKDVHWIVPIIATVPFACGNLLIFVSPLIR
jgi:MFS family permease